MPVDVLLLVAILLVMGVLYHVIPRFTRPDVFFAVTVAPEFRGSSEARRIEGRFRTVLWSATLAAVVLDLAAGLTAGALVVQTAGFLWALAAAHRRTLPNAASPSPIVEIDLAAPRETLPGGPIVALLPAAFVAGLGLWVAFHWRDLPPRFPIHWSLRGPDNWVAATPAAVFGFLAIQAWMCLLPAAIAWGLLRWSRRVSATGVRAASERRFRRRVLWILIVTAYLLPFPAWAALFRPSAAVVDAWLLVFLGVVAALCVSLIRMGQGGSRPAARATAAAPATGDRTPDGCWKWGLFYVNPDDPAVFVEKRFGIGYTVNLGNRWTWALLALLAIPAPIALVFLR
jgi:uncharacterized membrane protein